MMGAEPGKVKKRKSLLGWLQLGAAAAVEEQTARRSRQGDGEV